MARIALGPAPAFKRYREFAPWLHDHFFERVCAFCGLQAESLEVEHVEPKAFAKQRIDDPTNLLLACSRCNGPGGKGDYHPAHTTRKRLPHDATGFAVHDVRVDDLADLYEVRPSGAIGPRQSTGTDAARARWCITLLKLDLPFLDRARREILDLRDSCQTALDALHEGSRAPDHVAIRKILDNLLPQLASRALFLELFGLDVSVALATVIGVERARARWCVKLR